MRTTFKALAMVSLLGLAACGGGETPAPEADGVTKDSVAESIPADVKKAAELARAIKAEPGKAAEILKAAGTDEASFRQLLYDIASDAKKSAAYTKLTK